LIEAPASSETLLLVEKPMVNTAVPNILGRSSGAIVLRPADQTINGLIDPLHFDKWNYLCVDGHVALMAPEETIKSPAVVTSYAPTLNYMWTRDPND
jgi:hypothetical protein